MVDHDASGWPSKRFMSIRELMWNLSDSMDLCGFVLVLASSSAAT